MFSNSQKKQQPEDEDTQYQIGEGITRRISELSNPSLLYKYSNASSTSQISYYQPSTPSSQNYQPKFVKDQQLYNDILSKLVDIKNKLYINNDDICLYLLYHYQWSQQKIINYITQNWKMPQNNTAIVKEQGYCNVCLSQTKTWSSGMCNHFYCKPCWHNYIFQKLYQGQIFFPCMEDVPCQKSPVLISFATEIAPTCSELYRKKICVSYALQSKDVSYCTSQKCNIFVSKPTLMVGNSNFKCLCGQRYCFNCRQQPHSPADCYYVVRWKNNINDDNRNNSWLQNNTRQCPKCHNKIQKKVGCSFIRCLCETQFCYQCNNVWDSAHTQSKNQCPYRGNGSKKVIKEDRVVKLEQYLQNLQKKIVKHEQILTACQQIMPDQTTTSRMQKIRSQVQNAWTNLKWSHIILTLDNLKQVDAQIQQDYISSIDKMISIVQQIVKNGQSNNTISSSFYQLGQYVLHEKQTMKRNEKVWNQAVDSIRFGSWI